MLLKFKKLSTVLILACVFSMFCCFFTSNILAAYILTPQEFLDLSKNKSVKIYLGYKTSYEALDEALITREISKYILNPGFHVIRLDGDTLPNTMEQGTRNGISSIVASRFQKDSFGGIKNFDSKLVCWVPESIVKNATENLLTPTQRAWNHFTAAKSPHSICDYIVVYDNSFEQERVQLNEIFTNSMSSFIFNYLKNQKDDNDIQILAFEGHKDTEQILYQVIADAYFRLPEEKHFSLFIDLYFGVNSPYLKQGFDQTLKRHEGQDAVSNFAYYTTLHHYIESVSPLPQTSCDMSFVSLSRQKPTSELAENELEILGDYLIKKFPNAVNEKTLEPKTGDTKGLQRKYSLYTALLRSAKLALTELEQQPLQQSSLTGNSKVNRTALASAIKLFEGEIHDLSLPGTDEYDLDAICEELILPNKSSISRRKPR